MGNCAGRDSDSEHRVFKVTNINDEHRLVHKGEMIVTLTDLIYVDSKTKQQWEWPFKFLRRYGCEGNVFSFEAGRKCANGEGTYAFICDKANDLFTIVARNIANGNVQPDVEMPNGTLNEFPLQRPPLDNNGVHPPLPELPPPEPDPPPKNPAPPLAKNYSNLVFTKDSTEPIPSQANDHAPYSQISFERTEELSRQSKKHISLSDVKIADGRHHRRHTSGSTSSAGKRRRRSRENRSPSVSSNSSINMELPGGKFPSVTEIIPEGQPSRHRSSPAGPESSYQNMEMIERSHTMPSGDLPTYSNIEIGSGEIVAVGPSPSQQPEYTNLTLGSVTAATAGRLSPEDQQNYQNLIPGQGVVSSTPIATPTQQKQPDYFNFTPGAEPIVEQPNYSNIMPGPDVASSIIEDNPNYLNITPGPNVASSLEVLPQHHRSNTFNHSEVQSYQSHRSTTLPHIKNGGADSTQTYIELDIPGSSGPNASSTNNSRELRSERVTSTSSITRPPPPDETHTDYTFLNFTAMDALRSIKEERDKDIQKKEEEREAKQQQQQEKSTGKRHKSHSKK